MVKFMDDRCIVVLPTYNGEAYIQQTLDSVLSQTYDNYIIAIFDDASQDRTVEIVRQYEQEYPTKIKFKQNKHNLGVGRNLQKIYAAFKDEGKYLAMIGQDDIWDKDYLSEQIASLKKNDALVSFAKLVYIDSQSKKTSGKTFYHELINSLDAKDLYLKMMSGCFLSAPASVIDLGKLNRDDLVEFWGYNNDRLQDYEVWMHLILIGKIIYSPKAICNYRLHNDNFSNYQKRVTQGRLEFYSTLRRSLFSKEFLQFLRNLKNEQEQEEFLQKVLVNLQRLSAYTALLKVLIIDFCEYIFLKGFYFDSLDQVLRYYYEDFGVFSKAVKNGSIPAKIQAVVWGYIYDSNIKYLLENSNYFSLTTEVEQTNFTNMVFVQADYIEHYINYSKFFNNYSRNQVVIFCKGEPDYLAMKEKYSNALVLPDTMDQKKLDRTILSYVEDKTSLMHFNSPIPNRLDYLYVDNTIETQRIIIEGDFKFIRRIRFVDSVVEAAEFQIDGKIEENVLYENNDFLFEDNQYAGTLTILLEKPLSMNNRIVVNNELYVVKSVTMDDDGYSFVYKQLCFYNANAYVVPSIVNYSNLIQNNDEFQRLRNVKSYKYYTWSRNFFGRLSFLREIFSKIDKLIASIYHRVRIRLR